ncbi:MAG: AbrB/MazE/SpoVT family DNA-binding domain-containing protein [Thiohalospira sp.]|uniref:AbrB/MazE/SpoVT family DNA-binding domain-containing protein n=1 Tax=Thiohalospira sp. TaxID=3080549 RepID=UPI00397E9E4E
MEATVTSKGQITLPKGLREQLRLHTGDRVVFLVGEDGSVHLIPKRASLDELKGIVPAPGQPVGLEEMERAIEQGASEP